MNIFEYAKFKKIFGGSGGGSGSGALQCIQVNPTKNMNITNFIGLNISFASARSIGESAFEDANCFATVDLPVATSIGSKAFLRCTNLESIDAPCVESVGDFAFYTTGLLNVDLPVATSIGENAFEHSCVRSINLPNAISIGGWAFQSAYELSQVYAPKVESVAYGAFRYCKFWFAKIDLPSVTSIGAYAFGDCEVFDTLILSNTETVCQLDASAVMGTKIATEEGMPTGEGFIYVPTKFYEDYVTLIAQQGAMFLMSQGMSEAEAAATADYIARAILRKIEDYPEICG